MQAIFRRVERKFYISKSQYDCFLDEIKDHIVKDEYSGDDGYKIESIYFDNEQYSLTKRSIMKPYFKEKLRKRQYSKDFCFIEMKRKLGKIVYKRRIKLFNLEYDSFINNNVIPIRFNAKQNQIAKEIIYMINKYNLKPKIIVNYDRLAYYDVSNKDLRITFDHNINYQSVDDENNNGCLVSSNEYVMEIKFLKALPLWLVEALDKTKITKKSFSKCKNSYLKIKKGER